MLVGCNYPGTESELHGCINDVVLMHETLVQRFRFIPTNIVMLTDAENGIVAQPDYPSSENINSALSKMIDQAEPGDVLMFFSGHGLLLQEDQHDDDSCHSGGLIDKEKEQIGDEITDNPSGAQVTDNSGEDQVTENSGRDHVTGNSGGSSHHRRRHKKHHHKHHKVRGIDHCAIMKHLRSKSGLESDNISYHLVHLSFGMRVRLHPDNGIRLHPDNGILLSGANIMNTQEIPGHEPHGAFTNALLSALKEHEDPISNEELVRRTRSMILINEGVEDQHPCLYSSDSNKDAPFLFEGLN
ncbi:hypothetical protein LUZ60_015519 [Juncus effusus]|nr:hypothetical protein LUZ60_015519 [Juncus effusus]